MRPMSLMILLLLLMASPSAAQRDVTAKDAVKAVVRSFVIANQGREIEVLVPESLPEVATAAREIGVAANTRSSAIECEGDRQRRCRLPTADMLISLDELKIDGDSASVIVGLAFGDREEFDDLYLQIWYVKLVRRGSAWQVTERILDIET